MPVDPPKIIYFCDPTPKRLFFSLNGIKSALKTSWHARDNARRNGKPDVWRGVVTWDKIELD